MESIDGIVKALLAERKRIDKALKALGTGLEAPRKRKAKPAGQNHVPKAPEAATGLPAPPKRERGRPRKDAAPLIPSGT